MPIEITMPRLSDTMEEGTLIKWRVKVGDTVKSGDLLADVETDKATMELQSFDDGTVAHLAVEEGQTTKVGSLILLLAAKGEDPKAVAQGVGSGEAGAEGSAPKTAPSRPQAASPQTEESAPDAKPQPAEGKRIRVSPLARKLAEEHGVDLSRITGTGPDGRIIKRDILEAAGRGNTKPPTKTPAPTAKPASSPPASPSLQSKSIPLTSMRKTIARRLVESKTTVPHFTVSTSVAMDALLELRQMFNQQMASAGDAALAGVKLSVNDFIIRAAALALARHPEVNSSWSDAAIQQHGSVNIGIAVALPTERGGGLVVPVIRDVQDKGLRQISHETRQLADKARTSGLTVEEMSGGTFTISNLGMFGVDHFEAIINPPQAAILAVGAALAKPVVREGKIVIGQEMVCTLSADHRVVDGAQAAQFLQTLKSLLEHPVTLLSWS